MNIKYPIKCPNLGSDDKSWQQAEAPSPIVHCSITTIVHYYRLNRDAPPRLIVLEFYSSAQYVESDTDVL